MNHPFQTLSPFPSAPTLFIPSFQSPVPISGKPWAQLQAVFQRPVAVFVHASVIRAYLGQPVVFLLVRTENRRVQEGHLLVENGRVARNADVMCNDQWQEEEIVGDARADAAARGRMPPVLHVAFLELPRRRAQDLCARLLRGAVDDGHRVLELVAEAECPARLVEGRPAPHSAGERLIEQPAVQHQVQRRVRRADLDRPEDAIPERADFLQRCLHPARSGVGADESPGLALEFLPARAGRRSPPPRLAALRVAIISAAQGSTSSPARPESRDRQRAAGASGEPSRPRNSARSVVKECGGVSVRIGLRRRKRPARRSRPPRHW